MEDDLNTPEALATLFEVAGKATREISARPEAAEEFASLAGKMEEILGILGFDLAHESAAELDGVRVRYEGDPEKEVLRRAAEREKARRTKDWAAARPSQGRAEDGGLDHRGHLRRPLS